MHGHAIGKAIERNSEDVLAVERGSLYPALHRLMKRNLVSAEDGISENNRKARFYRLTAKSRKQLAVETTSGKSSVRFEERPHSWVCALEESLPSRFACRWMELIGSGGRSSASPSIASINYVEASLRSPDQSGSYEPKRLVRLCGIHSPT